MNDRAKALHEAADYAEFYAEERMRLCGDSILHDPILRGSREPGSLAKSRQLQIDGTINSAAYHAGSDIAAHLRALAKAAE
jgi:hypothetical protein